MASRGRLRRRGVAAGCLIAAAVWGMGGTVQMVHAGTTKTATFGAGCFWGVEKIFAKIPGVVGTSVGYAGGVVEQPTYQAVCTGRTGHAEAVEVRYDPARVRYEELLITFWEWHDPTTPNRQGPDVGTQYRSVIFTHDAEQAALATESKALLEAAHLFHRPIVTEIVPAGKFYRAEEYHQQYLVKNPGGYCSHHLQPQSPTIRRLLEGRWSRRRAPKGS